MALKSMIFLVNLTVSMVKCRKALWGGGVGGGWVWTKNSQKLYDCFKNSLIYSMSAIFDRFLRLLLMNVI